MTYSSERRFSALIAGGVLLLVILSVTVAQAQSFQVLHNFTGGADGNQPYGGLAIDAAGRLYGTTIGSEQCYTGCGNVYRFAWRGSGWVLTPLYAFRASNDGSVPTSTVTIAADGTLYGTTAEGGGTDNYCFRGCGTVYRLQPPAQICPAPSCSWTEIILYAFHGDSDLTSPSGEVVFDGAGNLFGATYAGGPRSGFDGLGGVYELTPGQGQWSYQPIYEFAGSPNEGCSELGSLLLDRAGNIYGTTSQCGAYGDGSVYELSRSGSGWNQSFFYSFGPSPDGGEPISGLISDAAGNLYGTTPYGGLGGFGEVFQFSPISGGYTYSPIYNTFTGGYGPSSKLAMDAAGNLYGTQYFGGANNQGMIFKLTPGNGGWTLTDLHDFTGADGTQPFGTIVFDRNGNLYGTARFGGAYGDGVLWELTP